MEIFRQNLAINFMGKRKYTGSFSVLLVIISILLVIAKGLNFGLEFTGGMQIELKFPQAVEIKSVEKNMATAGFKDMRVQYYGSTKEIMIRTADVGLEDENVIKQKLNTAFQESSVEIRRIEYVGSEVGQQLAEQGGMAVLVAILSTMIYIALRFEYRFALSAAVALVHDAIIVLGIFALLQIEFDLASLAAMLAVLGYSLNDTIVVFDRVRENFRKIRRTNTEQVINISINHTLSRTIMTSWLTLLVVLALLFFGGESLFGFSLALCIGIVVGTYSSIYVAGACALWLGLSRADLLPRPKADLDDMP